MLNEKKYDIPKATNRDTKTEIPEDEPVFLLRAKDRLSTDVLKHYAAAFQSGEMKSNLQYVIGCFEVWQYENKDKCKSPD